MSDSIIMLNSFTIRPNTLLYLTFMYADKVLYHHSRVCSLVGRIKKGLAVFSFPGKEDNFIVIGPGSTV
jgi:hypothetical protein